VQPVIHREIDAPQVRMIEQHTYENVPSVGPSLVTMPTIVQEVVHPMITEEIQPIIHREVPQTVIERQEQHTTEHVVQPTTTTKQVLEDRSIKSLPAVPQQLVKPLPTTPILHSTTAATTVESHTMPTVLQQTARPEKVTEVQPIIHREIDAPQVHLIEKHLYERVPSSGPGIITNQAIVQETIHPKIIEEVQPVLHRNVPAPFLERVEQHTTEFITQPTTSTKQVLVDNNITTLPTTFAPAGGPLPTTQNAPINRGVAPTNTNNTNRRF